MPSQLLLPLQFPDAISFDSFYDVQAGSILEGLKAALAKGKGSAYLFGPSPSGKTHLLQAACAELMLQGKTTAYLPLGEVKKLSPEYIEHFEQLSLIAIDDIEAIEGLIEWQKALFHLHHCAFQTGSTLLLISGQHAPEDLSLAFKPLLNRLRFEKQYSLVALNDEQKLKALQHSAAARSLELSREVAQFIFHRLPTDLPSLFDSLNRLDKASLQTQRRLTIPFVKTILSL